MPDPNPSQPPAPQAPAPQALPWYAKLAAKLFKSKVAGWVHTFFHGKPGLLRTVLAVFVLAMAVLPVVGPDVGKIVGAVGDYLGLAGQAVGVPVDPAALAKAFSDWWLATLALVALLRPVIRWVLDAFKKAPQA